MKKLTSYTLLLFLFISFSVSAQFEYYPSTFGRQTINGGTARYMSIGGAATALGADLGAAYVNPAGLGMYRKSEISITPTFSFSGSSSSFLNETERDNKGSFGISNIGVAICGNKDILDNSDWRGGTFSIGMSKTNNLHSRISFSGVDQNNNMVDYFVEQANGTLPQDYLNYSNPSDPNGSGITDVGGLAYYTYLVEPETDSTSKYYSGIHDETVLKEATYRTRGNQTQWNFAYGANYKDKLYIGGGLGLTGINYKEDLIYTETVGYNINGNFISAPDTVDYFTYNDYNTLKGTGINFKLGYIYKPVDAIRFGTTITTPTYYWMTKESSSDLTAQYASNYIYYGDVLGEQSQSMTPATGKFNYTSPLKLATGLAFFIGKAGFLSFDAEYIPYQFSSFQSKDNKTDRALNTFNNTITNTYKNVVNLRAGGEVRLDIFKLRLGAAYLPSPFDYIANVNTDIAQITGGIGVKLDNMYFDLGIVNSRFEVLYEPYSLSNETTSSATSKISNVNVAFTLGFYFE